MANVKSQFNKRHPGKRMSNTGRMARSRARMRMSLAKSIGKIRKGEEETPIVAIQKVHLFRKQKEFLIKQAYIFEKKAESVKGQVRELEKKIKIQKTLASDLVDGLEKDTNVVEEITHVRRSKPDRTIGQKAKGIFKLRF
jgi:hypothetical protein